MVEDFFATKMPTTKTIIWLWCHSFWPSDSVADLWKKKQGAHMNKTAIMQVNNRFCFGH